MWCASPAARSAYFIIGGPTTWLMTETATIVALKSGPHVKCAEAFCARPSVTPACVRKAIQ